MKLTWAQVQHFRSIEDSGRFAIDDRITCLVGKNESGKTALLTALYRLNSLFPGDGKFDLQRDYPRRFLADYDERHTDGAPAVIRTWWLLEDDEKDAIEEKFGPWAMVSDEVLVERGYGDKTVWHLHLDEAAITKHLVETSALADDEKASLDGAGTLAELREKAAAIAEPTASVKAFAQSLATLAPGGVHRAVTDLLTLPTFMFFTQYQRLQGQVGLEVLLQRKKNPEPDDRVFLALCDLAGTTIEKVAAIQQFEELVSRFEGASNKITAEIFEYWSQNRFLRVQFRLDPALTGDPPPFNQGRIFRTRIHNELHQVTVPFDDRSSGFVWFFSFLALFSQVKRNHPGKIILLLDEPGLTLHGKAQADLLRYFDERLAPHHQVIYTTHSPFMVPAHDLLAVRTVEDLVDHRPDRRPVVHGTKVRGDVLSTDRETLFPLQGALGYEITQSLFVGEHTLLVEGPSDVLYLKALSEELRSMNRTGLDPRWTVCPTGGIDKVAAFMSLFGGNGLHVAVLTDFATGQKRRVDDIRRSDLLRQGHVFTADAYAGRAEADIEDLLGDELYVHLVNTCYALKGKDAVPPPGGPVRIVKHVEDHFRGLTNGAPEFDHYRPSSYLFEKRAAVLRKAPGLDDTLKRFETLFVDLNSILDAP